MTERDTVGRKPRGLQNNVWVAFFMTMYGNGDTARGMVRWENTYFSASCRKTPKAKFRHGLKRMSATSAANEVSHVAKDAFTWQPRQQQLRGDHRMDNLVRRKVGAAVRFASSTYSDVPHGVFVTLPSRARFLRSSNDFTLASAFARTGSNVALTLPASGQVRRVGRDLIGSVDRCKTS